ncbi:MAG: RNA-directed DNA polymerase [Roseovarius sp.]|nr:RNA-directed DNA polymerase [Roseovarius sp.]
MAANLDGVFLRKVWKRLRDSAVPIVDSKTYSQADLIAEQLSRSIDQHLFLPSTIHGYLGIQKGGGVTRFLPILRGEDIGVYYYLCYRLAPRILVRQRGVYGAWHMKPEMDQESEDNAAAYGQEYGFNPFSSYWWLKEWRQFNDLISAMIADRAIGNYVVSTDIANFYDSIEIPRLISRIRKIASSEADTVEALNAFLSSWNRRHVGYMPSTKGIPQEIISDASRILSHFYLQEFDGEFARYCDLNGLTYARWSDDFLIFGGSKQKLESAVHHASRLLRDLGLNLNASKTNYTSKRALKRFRALPMLSAISDNDIKAVNRELKKVKREIANGDNLRLDTVFRALIGFLSKNAAARSSTNIAFIHDVAEQNRDLLHSLNNTQMLRYIQLMDKSLDAFDSLRSDICRADFGGPKASYLHMMRRYRSQLATIGMTQRMADRAISQIESRSADSDVIQEFCVPLVRQQYTK